MPRNSPRSLWGSALCESRCTERGSAGFATLSDAGGRSTLTIGHQVRPRVGCPAVGCTHAAASVLVALTLPRPCWSHSRCRVRAGRTHAAASVLVALTLPRPCWSHSRCRVRAGRTHAAASVLVALTLPRPCWSHSRCRVRAGRTHAAASVLVALTLPRPCWSHSRCRPAASVLVALTLPRPAASVLVALTLPHRRWSHSRCRNGAGRAYAVRIRAGRICANASCTLIASLGLLIMPTNCREPDLPWPRRRAATRPQRLTNPACPAHPIRHDRNSRTSWRSRAADMRLRDEGDTGARAQFAIFGGFDRLSCRGRMPGIIKPAIAPHVVASLDAKRPVIRHGRGGGADCGDLERLVPRSSPRSGWWCGLWRFGAPGAP